MLGKICYSFCFVIGSIWYQTIYLKNSCVYISVKYGSILLQMHPHGGPYTHNKPHQRGAMPEAAEPLFVQEKSRIRETPNLSTGVVSSTA